jgi:hypothetical protein
MNTINSTGPVEGTSKVTEPRPSNPDAPQDPQALKIRVDESKVGAITFVTCPTCGAESVAEAVKPDISKLSGRTSSRRYLRYKIEGANRTLTKLRQAEVELEEKFAKADQKAQDLALMIGWSDDE